MTRMTAKLSILLALALLAAPAAAQDLRVRNKGDRIYKLYVWASELAPAMESSISFPIDKEAVETISVDNNWSKCLLSFMIDRNDPGDLKRKSYIPIEKSLIEVNVCRRTGRPIDLP
jgi:hypothetical protein